MNDDFQFGEHAKRPARLERACRRACEALVRLRLVWVVAGLVVAAVIAFVVLSGADEAGKQIADAQSGAVAQIDTAYDAAAQGIVGRAVVVAQSLHAEHGTFTTDLATLSAFDPSLRFTSGPSTSPSRSPTRSAGCEFAPPSDRNRVPAGG